uniref:Uncharacterized protein n=1 Tax=Siphoviridae sp. ctSdk10 TaxID=2826345 RepID=A0A8S5MJY0_9CAUD|nr:MAG TPA: hypothetical protein [Siphoviridae sp. ctSdk10]
MTRRWLPDATLRSVQLPVRRLHGLGDRRILAYLDLHQGDATRLILYPGVCKKGPRGLPLIERTHVASRLIVSADDILKAVKESEEFERKALSEARKRDRAEGKEPRETLYPNPDLKPGREIVLDYIKNPERRRTPRCSVHLEKRTANNSYRFIVDVSQVRNRELADEIEKDLFAFMDYLLDEYDIPRRIKRSTK